MTLNELLQNFTDEEIVEKIELLYEKTDGPSYFHALSELRLLTPIDNGENIQIRVALEKEPWDNSDKIHYCVNGIEPDSKETYGLEFSPWENWLAWKIDENSRTKLDDLTILSCILWEMTFNGYSVESIKIARDELEESIREIDEMIKNSDTSTYKTLDEVREELDKLFKD